MDIVHDDKGHQYELIHINGCSQCKADQGHAVKVHRTQMDGQWWSCTCGIAFMTEKEAVQHALT